MKLHDLAEMSEGSKFLIDLASFWTLLATLLSMLPAFATVFTVLWTLFRMLETRIAQAMIYRATGFDLGAWMDHRRPADDDDA